MVLCGTVVLAQSCLSLTRVQVPIPRTTWRLIIND